MSARNLPDFNELPVIPGTTLRSSWGLFDKNGERDQLGCLNLLTPEVAFEAIKDVRVGVSVSLKSELHR